MVIDEDFVMPLVLMTQCVRFCPAKAQTGRIGGNMMFVNNAASLWMAPSGVIPGGLSFELVPAGAGWMILLAVLAAVCAGLWIVTQPPRPVVVRRNVRLLGADAKRRPRPQHA